jgi:hypothetical protein
VKRSRALVLLRAAGYANDRQAWVNIMHAGSVSLTTAQHCWTAGRRLRKVVDDAEGTETREADDGNAQRIAE